MYRDRAVAARENQLGAGHGIQLTPQTSIQAKGRPRRYSNDEFFQALYRIGGGEIKMERLQELLGVSRTTMKAMRQRLIKAGRLLLFYSANWCSYILIDDKLAAEEKTRQMEYQKLVNSGKAKYRLPPKEHHVISRGQLLKIIDAMKNNSFLPTGQKITI